MLSSLALPVLLLQCSQRAAQHAHLPMLAAEPCTRSTQLLQQLLQYGLCAQPSPCPPQRTHQLPIQQHLICQCISNTVISSAAKASSMLLVCHCCRRLRGAAPSKRVQAAALQPLQVLVMLVLQQLLLLLPLLHMPHHRCAVRRLLQLLLPAPWLPARVEH